MLARPRPQSPFICLRCLRKASLSQPQVPRRSPRTTRPQRRPFSSSTAPHSSNNPPPPPPSGITALPHRRLISLSGRDAAKFLQGLTTNNVSPFATTGWYTAFLNAQGRVLYDCFVYPASSVRGYREWLSGEAGRKGGDGLDWGCFIEVDGSVLEEVTKHLKRHKLRSKVNIRAVGDGEWGVWAAWDDSAPSASSHSDLGTEGRRHVDRSSGDSAGSATLTNTSTSLIHIPDSRAPRFGHRIVSTTTTSSSSPPLAPPLHHLPQTTPPSYHLRRLLHGIPEGPLEIPPAAALPLEHNIDLMSGIDFHKGCYVGQELTIRTKHTGVVRKRVLPVQLYKTESVEPERLAYDADWAGPRSPPKDAEIKMFDALRGGRKGRAAGKFIASVANVGLAMCRLEMMTDIRLTAESAGAGAHVPGTEFGIKWVVDEPQEGREGGGSEEVVKVKAFVPDWHRERGWEGKVQRRVG